MSRVARLLAAATSRLARTSQTPRLDAQLLLACAAGTSRARLAALQTGDLGLAAVRRFNALVHDRASARTPVAYLTGVKPFWTLDLEVSRHTLIPRPDTETLVEAVLAHVPRRAPLSILDVGTGSGCVLLALLSELPHAVGVGVDVCPRALQVAARNAQKAGVSSRCSFHTADMRHLSHCGDSVSTVADALRELGASRGFDVVACNPPYIPHSEAKEVAGSVAGHEPALALWGWGADGVGAYSALAALDPALLARPSPLLAVEIGVGAEDRVRSAIGGRGWGWSATQCDLAGIPRALLFHRRQEAGSGETRGSGEEGLTPEGG